MSDRIEIKLFADLRTIYQREDTIPITEPQVISDVLKKLKIPEKKVSIILKNGKHANPEDTIKPGDRLAIFPPLGGG